MSKKKTPFALKDKNSKYLSFHKPNSLDIPITKGFLLEEEYFMLHLQGC